MTYRLGIDLGTTTLVAAVRHPGRPGELLGLGQGRPDASVEELRDRELTVEEATAALLGMTRERAAKQYGGPPDEVVLAVPGWWGDVERAPFDAALELVDLGTVRRIDQAEAAALGYAAGTFVPEGARVAVFDLGGGSCTATVLERTPSGFTGLAVRGAAHPSGSDFDEAVSRLVAGSLGDWGRQATAADRAATFRRACIVAREALSEQPQTEVVLPGLVRPVPLTRAEVESLIRGPVREGLAMLEQALAEAGVAPADLAAILAVGGCSRTPIVPALLSKEFAVRVEVVERPELEVALGSVCDADTCRPEVMPPPVPPPAAMPTSWGGPASSTPAAGSSWAGPTEVAAAAAAVPPGPAGTPAAPVPPPPTSPPPAAPPRRAEAPPLTLIHPAVAPPPVDVSSLPTVVQPVVAPPPAFGSPPPTVIQPAVAPSPATAHPPAPVAAVPPPSPLAGPATPAAVSPVGSHWAVAAVPPPPPPRQPPAAGPPTPGAGPPPASGWHGQPAPDWQAAAPASGAVASPPAGGGGGGRRTWLIVAGAVVVVAAIAAWFLFPRGAAPGTAGATVAASSPAATPPPTTAPPTGPPLSGPALTLSRLPKGPAIDERTVVVPMQLKGRDAETLYLVDVDGRRPPKLLQAPAGSNNNPMMQDARNTIMYLNQGRLRVMASDAKKGDRPLWQRQPSGCSKVVHASWNRLNPVTLLVSCEADNGTDSLMVVDLDGKVIRKLRTGTRLGDFSVSPDGRTVVFWQSADAKAPGGSLFLMPTDGSVIKPIRLTAAASVDAHPVWSPDGTVLSFSRRVAATATAKANWDVYTMRPVAGATPKRLLTGPTDDFKAVWSPDGQQHLVISNRTSAKGGPGAGVDLWVIGLDGTVEKRLNLKAIRITRPFWALR